jgi:hypothetical protein
MSDVAAFELHRDATLRRIDYGRHGTAARIARRLPIRQHIFSPGQRLSMIEGDEKGAAEATLRLQVARRQ